MLTAYENLLDQYNQVPIREVELAHGFTGLYYDGRILIHNKLTEVEKHCVLSEELGHHFTSAGEIIRQNTIVNIKQEKRARRWGYSKIISLAEIVHAYHIGCQNRYEIAHYLNVTEEFLQETLDWYKQKYGTEVSFSNYFINFEPLLIKKLKY
ncbi:ImmA/IrrE family metallo-endopeptidase [Priestia flexa]|jgi:hypothetical protein|uniref:ImmA/IrrE family metallo-endopeptidase n=1 Tax=Priestia flexa TaxID=86664 RepID=UPI00240D5306|nr:ImmA/IrrE family metallo-endopeptidase [Priestia flexa]WEZ09976.1 ImmA/IrrE family metallo-endopeptidase [Priestia flexa]